MFGTLALATCWLPIVGGPIGWIGIVGGSLGLVLGITGLTLAAIHRGSGLALGIAGTSSSLVGLVLGLVMALQFGLFAGAAPRPAVALAAPTILAPAIAPVEAPPAAAPEPEVTPEPQWFDAGEPIRQGAIEARVASVAIEKIALESTDFSTLKRQKPQPMLKIRLTFENTSTDKIVDVPGWPGGGDLIGQGVTQILGGEAAKAVQSATATALLTDSAGNKYAQTPLASLFGARRSRRATWPCARQNRRARARFSRASGHDRISAAGTLAGRLQRRRSAPISNSPGNDRRALTPREPRRIVACQLNPHRRARCCAARFW